MLRKLSVRNFAIIRSLEISFDEGFTVITGETGAGKSILMGALAMVTGARADSSVLLDQSLKCVVEAEFNVTEKKHGEYFEREDIDFQNPCIIRREINPAGKSRSFINDTPVSLQQLRDLSSTLVDIHSQHQSLEIKDNTRRFEYLDTYARNAVLFNNYREHYLALQRLNDQLKTTEEAAARDSREMDYLKFQLSELEAFRPLPAEYETLKEQHELLSNAEQTASALSEALYLLDDSEASVRVLFSRTKNLMPQVARLGESGRLIKERFFSLETELKDVCSELRDISDRALPDPEKLEAVSARMSGYEQLFRKHHCADSDALCRIQSELEARCIDFSDLDQRIAALKNQIEEAEVKVQESGKLLSKSRTKAAVKFSAELSHLLKTLEMKDAVLEWKVQNTEQANPFGLDHLDLLFSANSGQQLQSLTKVVSGGELSRVMLSIKSIVAREGSLPAIIFDEIDTGVSGKVAASIGSMMRNMGKSMQVISITHLPQVAAHGNHHYEVYKDGTKGTTSTGMRILGEEERLRVIANMISHDRISDSALQHAGDLLRAGNLP
jgi:DNA repair protein RecN (Recombination protein N)